MPFIITVSQFFGLKHAYNNRFKNSKYLAQLF
jgi:hypothetical protein